MKPLVLLLSGKGADVLINALVRHAMECEKEGDPLGEIAIADEIVLQASTLQDMHDEVGRQVLLSLGIGVARGRPQG
jgi:hypothetical protein